MARRVRVQPARVRERQRRTLDAHELGERVALAARDRRARRATSPASSGSASRARIQTSVVGPATLIGPWRYSIAG